MEQNNNIEKFFQKKFSEPVSEQEWNSPPDDSWDNILDGLEEKKPKRRLLFILPWLLGGLGLFLGLYMLISNENQSARIETLEKKIDHIKQSSNNETKQINSTNPVKTNNQ